jgi:hypothetical protein
MSTSSPYPRQNFWGEDLDVENTDDQDSSVADGSPPEGYTMDLARWKAHAILKESATKLCGKSWSEGGLKIELTEPVIHPPDEPVADQRHARRYNPERGYISGPHDTWVKLDDRPREQFLSLVESLLDLWRESVGLSDRECDCLREQARTKKRQQDTTDQEIVTQLILAVEQPDPVMEFF